MIKKKIKKVHPFIRVSNGKLRCDYGDRVKVFSATMRGAKALGKDLRKELKAKHIIGWLYSSSVDFAQEYGGQDIDMRQYIECATEKQMEKWPWRG